jgi:peptidoglycan-associated lipoprotein
MMIRFDRLSLFALLALPLLMGCPPKQPLAASTSGDLSAGDADDGTGIADNAPITAQEIRTLQENFAKVHFEFDRSELDDATRGVLAANAEILMRHADVQVRVEGHADSYGSDIYNLALGQRRADSVLRYMIDLGVAENQLAVISYGEERPLVNTGDAKAEAPNRRAEFLVVVGGDVVRSSY